MWPRLRHGRYRVARDLTKKQALLECVELWTELAEHPEYLYKCQTDSFLKYGMENYHANCPLCEWTTQKHKGLCTLYPLYANTGCCAGT